MGQTYLQRHRWYLARSASWWQNTIIVDYSVPAHPPDPLSIAPSQFLSVSPDLEACLLEGPAQVCVLWKAGVLFHFAYVFKKFFYVYLF